MPTAHICRLLSRDLLTDETVCSGIAKGSAPILYLVRSSISMVFRVFRLMCIVMNTVLTPFSASRLSKLSVKCNPAAGATKVPSC